MTHRQASLCVISQSFLMPSHLDGSIPPPAARRARRSQHSPQASPSAGNAAAATAVSPEAAPVVPAAAASSASKHVRRISLVPVVRWEMPVTEESAPVSAAYEGDD